MKSYKFRAMLTCTLIFGIVSSALSFSKMTERRIDSLHRVFAEKLRNSLAEIERRNPQYDSVEVTSGYRTFGQQDKLHTQGKTPAKGGQSYHNYALAADFAPKRNGKLIFNDDKFYRDAARVMTQNGLESGYYWRRKDALHVQLPSKKVRLRRMQEAYAENGLKEVFLDVDRIYGRTNWREKSTTSNSANPPKRAAKKTNCCDCQCGR